MKHKINSFEEDIAQKRKVQTIVLALGLTNLKDVFVLIGKEIETLVYQAQ